MNLGPAQAPQSDRMAKEIRPRVFIVDDSPAVRDRLLTLLSEIRELEFIGEADNAFTAINRIERLKPEVVILDISMPGANGLQVLENIKRVQPAPLIIMLTNFSHDQYRLKCQQLGADHFFDKSTEFDKVIEVIRGWMASQEAASPSRIAAA